MKFLRIFPLLIIMLIACEQKETVQTPDEFVVITEEIVEKYDSVLVDTEYITYEYAGENDYFWKKKVVKDTAGNVIKVVEREFDQSGMPVKEVVTDEIGTQIDKAVLKFDPKTMELIQKDQYEGEIADENRTRTVNYHYDDDGYLISEEVKVYTEDDDFKNINGINIKDHYTLRFMPDKKNRPKGYHETPFMIEKRVMYITPEIKEEEGDAIAEIGDIYLESKTVFDENGSPVSYESTHGDDHDAALEYFKVEKDADGKILSIAGYLNEALDSASFANEKWVFDYTEDGLFKSYEEYKYDDTTSTFNLFHDGKSVEWHKFETPLKYDFTLSSETQEHYCWHRNQYSKTVQKVEKFADGEILITEYSVSEPQDKPNRDVDVDKTKVIKMKYKKVKEQAKK
jgi:hypothetical protein